MALLSNLEQLCAYSNALTGSIPEEFGLLNKLEVLMLQNNSLTGYVPPSLGDLPLKKLQLHWNQIGGVIPMDICDLTLTSLHTLTADCAGAGDKVACNCCTSCY